MPESISLREIHGKVLTYENEDGERVPIAGMVCGDYPDCDVCGHIPEHLTEIDNQDRSGENAI